MPSLHRFLTRNWRLKLAAFGLALLLWTGVHVPTGAGSEVVQEVPIRVQLNDPDWVLASEPVPQTARVRLEGTNFLALQGADPVLRVPVDDVVSTDTVIQLRRNWLVMRGQGGTVVTDIRPSTVRLTFEEVVSRAVPLALRVTGSLPDTLSLAGPLSLSPQVARVSGPASRVETLDSVRVQTLDLSTVQSSTPREIPLDTTGLGDLSVSPAAVSVSVPVETRAERVVAGIPVTAEAPDDGSELPALEFLPATFQATLRGPRSRVRGIRVDSLRVVVSREALEGLAPGEERRVSVRIHGIPELVSAAAENDSVTVRMPEGG